MNRADNTRETPRKNIQFKRTGQRQSWTKLEIAGLLLSLFLIIWPVLTFSIDLVIPTGAGAQAGVPPVSNPLKAATPTTVAPGGAITFTLTFNTRAISGSDPTIVTITDVLPGDSACSNVAAVNAMLGALVYPISGTMVINAVVSSTSTVLVTLTATCTAPTGTGGYNNQYSAVSSNSSGSNSPVFSNIVGFTVSSSATTTVPPTTTTVPPTTTTVPPTTTTVPPTTTTVPPTTTTVPPTTTTVPPTTTTVPPTTTTVPPTTTTVPPTTTTVPTTTTTGFNTPVPPLPTQTPQPTPTFTPISGTTSGGSNPTATPTNTPAPTPGLPGQPAETPASTPNGTTSAATTTAPAGSGVVAGTVINRSGSVAGAPIDLIWVRAGGEQVLASTVIDSSGQFFFGGLGSTAQGESYYLRFRNSDPGGSTLRVFNTAPFNFTSGTITRIDNIDVTDVAIGAPGSNGQRITPPTTFEWSTRAGVNGERYSLTFFNSAGQVVLETGDLGGATSYILQAGRLPDGQYTVQVNVTNSLGSGVSNRRFTFGIGVNGPTTTAAPVTTAPGTTAPAATTQRPATTAGQGVTTTAAGQPANPTATPTRTATAGTTAGQAGTTGATGTTAGTSTTGGTTTLPGGGANVGGGELIGSQPTFGPANTGDGTGSRPGGGTGGTGNSGQLPSSGGELPVIGLALAAITMFGRRLRLIRSR